jgi:hypothetical protein
VKLKKTGKVVCEEERRERKGKGKGKKALCGESGEIQLLWVSYPKIPWGFFWNL